MGSTENHDFLDESRFGRPSFEALLNLGMRTAVPDPARVAASLIFSNSLSVVHPPGAEAPQGRQGPAAQR